MAPLEKFALSRFCVNKKEARSVIRAARHWRAQDPETRDISKVRLWRTENGKRREALSLAIAFWLLTVGYEKPSYALLGPFAAILLFTLGLAMMAKHLLLG